MARRPRHEPVRKFAARWSRLKRRSERKSAVDPVELPADPADADAVATDASSHPVFDPATLPPIDSITIGTDVRAFLQSGVPAELTRAALRRAWTSDPSIRDFIGIAENQWNFNDPVSIPGFGLFGPGEDMSVLVADALGALGQRGRACGEIVESCRSSRICGRLSAGRGVRRCSNGSIVCGRS